MSEFKTAIFAGGCFWCLQPAFDLLKGVISTSVGYCNGQIINPTYEQVCSGASGHYEALEVKYDPNLISYELLVNTFWQTIDPTQADGQFGDRGSQYLTAIFYLEEQQRLTAQASKDALEHSGKFDKPIATKILKAEKFYPAEEYHQQYYLKNPEHYQSYSVGSGRKGYISRVWTK